MIYFTHFHVTDDLNRFGIKIIKCRRFGLHLSPCVENIFETPSKKYIIIDCQKWIIFDEKLDLGGLYIVVMYLPQYFWTLK